MTNKTKKKRMSRKLLELMAAAEKVVPHEDLNRRMDRVASKVRLVQVFSSANR